MTKKVFNKRVLFALLFCLVLNVIKVYVDNKGFAEMYSKGLMTKVSYNEDLLSGAYYTIVDYAVWQAAIYLIFIEYVMNYNRICYMIRYVNRDEYWKSQIKNVTKATACFVFVHELVSFFLTIQKGDYKILMKHNWIQGLFLQFVAANLFYLCTYLFYEFLRSYFGKSKSNVLIVIIYFVEYVLSRNVLDNFWFPENDVNMMTKRCVDNMPLLMCFLGIFRLAMEVFIMSRILSWKKGKEDLLIYEKVN